MGEPVSVEKFSEADGKRSPIEKKGKKSINT